MFSSVGSFHNITCPEKDECSAVNCLFDHTISSHARANGHEDENQPPQKRRKLSPNSTPSKGDSDTLNSTTATPDPIKAATNNTLTATRLPINRALSITPVVDRQEKAPRTSQVPLSNGSATRTISPPPVRRKQASAPTANGDANATLNPRMIRNDPAGHATRTLYLKKLHEEMARLNKESTTSTVTSVKAIAKSENELITMALDEEEKIALESPLVYANVIKQRMMLYKKMSVEQWKALRQQDAQVPAKLSKAAQNHNAALDTGLSRAEELLILPHLIADQETLSRYGLVHKPPTDAEIKKSKAGVEAAQGWEKCDRCDSRFEVFPDRDEDGSLTSGGRCTYHHGRVLWPDRRDGGQGVKEKTWSCCGQVMGTKGCTAAETHVFKITDGKRLASVLQFERTPENPDIKDDCAVSFDCEMGYTVYGLELIRVTAVSWPDGEELLDILVRPLGTILDLNSRYSGITPEHFLKAIPYDADLSTHNSSNQPHNLPRIVPSPLIARRLLFSLLTPHTPLIGHAIENDLNATRIIHPTIIDTVVLYPHPRGLPQRRALKTLAKQVLSRDIQMGGAKGHDSREDAIATGDLVRVRVGKKWREMQAVGWRMERGVLVAPAPEVKESEKGGKGKGA